MNEENRRRALDRIRANIERFGYHVYVVTGGVSPRFLYTIGLSRTLGSELILAGAAVYDTESAHRIVSEVAGVLRDGKGMTRTVRIAGVGDFTLRPVHPSWTKDLVLGAFHYYQTSVIVHQIVPDDEHWTVDIPRLSRPRLEGAEPVWQWLTGPWPFPVPKRSVAVTNLDALRAQPVTEAARWEVTEWELFAGAGTAVQGAHVRRVPLATLLATDPTLAPVTELAIGRGLWRDTTDMVWHDWAKS